MKNPPDPITSPPAAGEAPSCDVDLVLETLPLAGSPLPVPTAASSDPEGMPITLVLSPKKDGPTTDPAVDRTRALWVEGVWAGFPAPVRDRYRFVSVVGEGGMGIVMEVEDLLLERRVAVKGPRDPATAGTEACRLMGREARLMARLTHPHILPVFDVWEDGRGNPWHAMLLITGGGQTLAMRLEKLRESAIEDRPLGELVRLYLQVCSAVEYAHSHGVLHLDLKPQNILLGLDGIPLVADWGIAHEVGVGGKMEGFILGTPGYASPEQRGLFGASWAEARSDVYSLGVVLFEILAGRPMTDPSTRFGGDTQASRSGRFNKPVEIPRRVGREFRSILERALAWSPADRFPSVAALMEAVGACMNDGLVEGLEYSSLERYRKWTRRNPRGAGAMLVSLVLASSFIFLLMYGIHLDWEEERVAKELEDILLQKIEQRMADLHAESSAGAIRMREPERGLHLAAMALETWPHARHLPDTHLYGTLGGIRPGGRLVWSHHIEPGDGSLAFHPDGRTLAVGGPGTRIELIDLVHCRSDRSLTCPAGDGKRLAYSADGRWLASAGATGTIHLWKMADPSFHRVIGRRSRGVRALSFDVLTRYVASASDDGTISVWDIGDGDEISHIPMEVPGPSALSFWWDQYYKNTMVFGSMDGTVYLWNVLANQEVTRLRPRRSEDVGENRDGGDAGDEEAPFPAESVAIPRSGTRLYLSGARNRLRVWDADRGAETAEGVPVDGERSRTFAVDPEGRIAVTAAEAGRLRVIDLTTLLEVFVLEGHTSPVDRLAISPDSRLAASASSDGVLRLWDLGDVGHTTFETAPGRPQRLALSPDGEWVAGTTAAGRLALWEMTSGFGFSPDLPLPLRDVRWLGPDRLVLVPRGKGTPRVWVPSTGSLEKVPLTLPGRVEHVFPRAGGDPACVTLDSGRARLHLPGAPPRGLPSGTRFLADAQGRRLAIRDDAGALRLVDVDTGVVAPVSGPAESVDLVAFSPSGRTLYYTTRAGNVSRLMRAPLEPAGPTAEVATLGADDLLRLESLAGEDGVLVGTRQGTLRILRAGETRNWTGPTWRIRSHALRDLALTADRRSVLTLDREGRMERFEIGALQDPRSLVTLVIGASPFESQGSRLMPRPPGKGEAPRFPADHPFRWIGEDVADDPRAPWRAARALEACLHRDSAGNFHPLGWKELAADWRKKTARNGLLRTEPEPVAAPEEGS